MEHTEIAKELFSKKYYCSQAVLAAFAAVIAFFIATDAVRFSFYPKMSGIAHTPAAIVCYVLYGLMCLLPVMNELEEKIKWRYLESRILNSPTV